MIVGIDEFFVVGGSADVMSAGNVVSLLLFSHDNTPRYVYITSKICLYHMKDMPTSHPRYA